MSTNTIAVVALCVAIVSLAATITAQVVNVVVARRQSRRKLSEGVAVNVRLRVDHTRQAVTVDNNSSEAVVVRSLTIGRTHLTVDEPNLLPGTSLVQDLPAPQTGGTVHVGDVTVVFEDARGWVWERRGDNPPRRVDPARRRRPGSRR